MPRRRHVSVICCCAVLPLVSAVQYSSSAAQIRMQVPQKTEIGGATIYGSCTPYEGLAQSAHIADSGHAIIHVSPT